MSAKALRPVCDSREQVAPWQPRNSALSGSDCHDFAASQALDIANWGQAKESPVLAIELARAFVADLESRTCRVQFTSEHTLPRGMKAKLLLKLQRTHRRKGAKMVVAAGSRQVLARVIDHGLQRLLPLLIKSSVDLQTTDATFLPGFFDRGRINAELEYRHCLLRSLGQHAVVFAVQFVFDPLGETSNFNLCIDREGLRLKEFQS